MERNLFQVRHYGYESQFADCALTSNRRRIAALSIEIPDIYGKQLATETP